MRHTIASCPRSLPGAAKAVSCVQSLQRRQRRSCRCSSGKGFGKQATQPAVSDAASSKKSRKKGKQAASQPGELLPPNELLKQFNLSPNKDVVAEAHADSLTEKFFVVADAMLKMAVKEGNSMMRDEFTTILRAAMKVRNKTLRPEIGLLNELMMASTTAETRRKRIGTTEGAEVLVMNDRYFFRLLEGIKKDLHAREESEGKADVLALVSDIERDCRERAETYETSGC